VNGCNNSETGTAGAATSFQSTLVSPPTNSSACPPGGGATTPPSCVETVGNTTCEQSGGTSSECWWTAENVAAGLDARIYGCTVSISGNVNTPTYSVSGCAACGTKGANYWATGNSIDQILDQSPVDPRLVALPITYYGAFPSNAGLDNTPVIVPITQFAEFYITGWWGDPCTTASYKGGGTGNDGLTIAADDTPPNDPDAGQDDGIDSCSDAPNDLGQQGGSSGTYCSDQGMLMGHFVKYVQPPGSGSGTSGCTSTTIGNCIGILTK
jgi:hypothetical protein